MKKVLSAFAVALALVGCAKQYDDSDLRNRVTTLETKVGNLEAQMKAANAVALGQYVQKVEKTDEGVTVTYGDGTVVTLKISAGRRNPPVRRQGPSGEPGNQHLCGERQAVCSDCR